MNPSSARGGDILRGGVGGGASPTGRANTSNRAPVIASKARENAKDTLSRTVAAVQAVQGMQKAAREAARRAGNKGLGSQGGQPLPNVKDGLGLGGLQVAPGVPVDLKNPTAGEDSSLWLGAELPKQSVASNGNVKVTIKQTSETALLTWESFNVGQKTTLRFDQSAGGSDAGKWIAFNKIIDPSGVPSQILGSIKAEGQVYVINPNGIIFGGSSQVNTHALVASTLPINEHLATGALLDNADNQFLFSALPVPAGPNNNLAFNPTISDLVTLGAGASYKLREILATNASNQPLAAPVIQVAPVGAARTNLAAGTDYTLSVDAADGHTVVTFTEAGLAKIGSSRVTASYTPVAVRSGDVIVQKGAQITSPTSSAGVGGRIALIGANVRNEGTISTPDGQTILAAGLQVGIAAHSKDDPSLRGLDVYVGKVSATLSPDDVLKGGTAINAGQIDIPRGNVTITGKSVKQLGAITSTTSVNTNGRIDLLAQYDATSVVEKAGTPLRSTTPYLFQKTGNVTFGADSVTQILPELSSDETITRSDLALNSEINVRGLSIYLAPDSTILAPSANVTLDAGVWRLTDLPASGIADRNTVAVFLHGSDGTLKPQIYLDAGATIDVSGERDVFVPLLQNILSVELRGSELADSPLQRDGVFRSQSITIDLRKFMTYNGSSLVGTPLANAQGYLGLIERTVGQLSIAGGTVKLKAGDSVVMQPGSLVDVSGGSLSFEGGMVQTSRVMAGGQLIDISKATPDRVYDGFYDPTFTSAHLKYGVTETFRNPLALDGAHFEPEYTQGAAGGTLEIVAPSMALDGSLKGRTTAGDRQREQTPAGSSLSISFKGQDIATITPLFPDFSPTPPNVVFGAGYLPSAGQFELDEEGNPEELREERKKKVILSPKFLTESGFSNLAIDNDEGNVTLPLGVDLVTAPKGSISISGANIDIQGQIHAPGGALTFKTFNISPYLAKIALADVNNPAGDTIVASPDRGIFTLGSAAVLNTAGLLVDDRASSDSRLSAPLLLNGGSVSISTFSASLAEGSLVDVSGGASIASDGKRTYGTAGAITVDAGRDLSVSSIIGGSLTLDGELRGFSGSRGGTLNLQAQLVQVGGTPSRPNTLFLDPEFFNTGGFTNFRIRGIGLHKGEEGEDAFVPAVLIAAGTILEPRAESVIAVPNQGGEGISFLPIIRPEAVRVPVSLAFEGVGAKNPFNDDALIARAEVVLGEGTEIHTDPRASVSFSGDTVDILGSVFAPGGRITVKGASKFVRLSREAAPNAQVTVHIGSDSILSTQGTVVAMADARGYMIGDVLPGGTISVAGNIVAEAGAVLDVSGTSGVLDKLPTAIRSDVSSNLPLTGFLGSPLGGAVNGSLQGLMMMETTIDSNAGQISLAGGEELFTNATLLGLAGGPTASGGQLFVKSGRFYSVNQTVTTTADINLIVTQSGSAFDQLVALNSGSVIGATVADAQGQALLGQGHFAANHFLNGGFDSLTLDGNVQFNGPVNISAASSISVGSGGIIQGDSEVRLTASYVKLGQAFRTPLQATQQSDIFTQTGPNAGPISVSPVFGTGHLKVNAHLIDVGNLSLQQIGAIDLVAVGGDVRGNGTLDIAGDVTIRAGQIYPTTASTFTISASDYTTDEGTVNGSVTIRSAGTNQFPLSAGSTLNIYASVIDQGGTVRAPLGTINLGWDGTGTAPVGAITGHAVAVTEQLTLGGQSVTSVSALDPITGQPVYIPYGINANDSSWIDPTGTDITAGGAPSKGINLSAGSISALSGSTIDLRGGGDFFAFRWAPGIGGSKDILATTTSFAVVPSYGVDYAPYAPFNDTLISGNLASSNPGYVNSSLAVGDRIYLQASAELAAGYYTLLPARYALLPGAFLVTPQSGTPVGSIALADGSSIVSGFRSNDLNASRQDASLMSRFEVVSGAVVRDRAEYHHYSGNAFLSAGARDNDVKVPPLPMDAGHLVLSASDSMLFKGQVTASAPIGGAGGLVDLSTGNPDGFIINDGQTPATGDQVVLNAKDLGKFGAESLLIGGIRSSTDNSKVSVTANHLVVDNAGATLTGSDIILVAKTDLTLMSGASIEAKGSQRGGVQTLTLGDASSAGSGNGTLVRVSSDSTAQIQRAGLGASGAQSLVMQGDVNLAGQSVILDSTASTALDATAKLNAGSISLNSGAISIVLDSSSNVGTGLVLAGATLEGAQKATNLSLLSYSTLDIYGGGTLSVDGRLALHAGAIRGFNSGETASFSANSILLDNSAKATVSAGGLGDPLSGELAFNADTIRLGNERVEIDRYSAVSMTAANGLIADGKGSMETSGAVQISAPVLTGTGNSSYALSAAGDLSVIRPTEGGDAVPAGGLGASLTLKGANVSVNSDILLSSGTLAVQATTGAVTIGDAELNVAGTEREFFDLVRYTGGGKVNLIADQGQIVVSDSATVDVSAPGVANAGGISFSARAGSLILDGTFVGKGGNGGSVSVDVASVPGDTAGTSELSALNSLFDTGGFTWNRSIRIRTGDVLVDGSATAHTFNLYADHGSINVSGLISTGNTEGIYETGGAINLIASGDVRIAQGGKLDASARDFDAAGKGGAVSLEAGSTLIEGGSVVTGTGTLAIEDGATIDLRVTAQNANSASRGQFTGKLHLRAPRLAGGTDLAIDPISGSVLGASAITVEGYKTYTPAGGNIDTAARDLVNTDGQTFGNAATAIADRLTSDADLKSVMVIAPGVEFINANGNLTLTSDWNLSTFRFGANSAPGVLTMRASGNLNFENAALSDGFSGTNLWLAPLMALNANLPVNAQSWSYRLTAGAELSTVDYHAVKSLSSLGANEGSLLLGKDGGANRANPLPTALTSTVINGHYQVIRTGSGDIDISTGRDVRLLNPFATIYTAGTRVADYTHVFADGDFSLPQVARAALNPAQAALGSVQQVYPVQYSYGGGNVSINAQADVAHYTKNTAGQLVLDSSRQLPNNWLYRRGYVDPLTGNFGATGTGVGATAVDDPFASTTWWIDFSNFFQSVGALGGGNVSLVAGHDIVNVDAVVPTNARMPGKTSSGTAARPDASKLLELGGGNLHVAAGRDLSGGVYYVERGEGTLSAANDITTNAARSLSLPTAAAYPERTWMPTTLFAGKSSFNVSAGGDLLIGPVANPFLLPQGVQNMFYNKTYFTTYSPASEVTLTSLSGDVTFRLGVNLPNETTVKPMLQAWIETSNLLKVVGGPEASAADGRPWLRVAETDILPFATVGSLLPPKVHATALAGDIDVIGDLTLFPATRGTLDLVARNSLNGLQPNGVSNRLVQGQTATTWGASQINVSDSDPASIPGIASPFGYFTISGRGSNQAPANTTLARFLSFIDRKFAETGSTLGAAGSIEIKQALHASGLLHAGDADPVHLYAEEGSLSGLTLFSPKAARILAGEDITDIGFYIENLSPSDVSVISAGRDIVAFNASSPLRISSRALGNTLSQGENNQSGDIQISGPGTVEVLAGRNLDLGVGNAGGPSDIGLGLTTIGNARNPGLLFGGASVIAGAGIGKSIGLETSELDVDAFVDEFLDPSSEDGSKYLPEVATLMKNAGVLESGSGLSSAEEIFQTFQSLPKEQQARFALEVFYMVLRDAGRGNVDAAGGGANYDKGFAAIDALFPGSQWSGDISLTSREIKTRNGGDISVFAPGGGLLVGFDIPGANAVEQGVLTESGGNISIFTKDDVVVGTSRIFTLRGGNEIIWSSEGDIAAGSAAKTVQSAPPTRVVIDPQSADVATDLSGLATGGGIGVLATVKNVPPGDVDLIAPGGVIDAGDAGIRVSGNLNLAATQVLNASNIQVSGSSAGAPSAPTVSGPNLSGISAGANAAGAASNAAGDVAQKAQNTSPEQPQQTPSIITVEVLGYGGGEGPSSPTSSMSEGEESSPSAAPASTDPTASPSSPNPDDEDEKRRRKEQEQQQTQ